MELLDIEESSIPIDSSSFNRVKSSICWVHNQSGDCCCTGSFVKIRSQEQFIYGLLVSSFVIKIDDFNQHHKFYLDFNGFDVQNVPFPLDPDSFFYINENFHVTFIQLYPEKFKSIFRNIIFFDSNENVEIDQLVYLVHYPKGEPLSLLTGKIIQIDGPTLIHNLEHVGSAGSPLLNQNFQMIGFFSKSLQKFATSMSTIGHGIEDFQNFSQNIEYRAQKEYDLLPERQKEVRLRVQTASQQLLSEIDLFNNEVDPQTKENFKQRIIQKASRGYLFENRPKLEANAEAFQLSETQEIHDQLIPNPYVREEVQMIPPVPLSQFQETREMLNRHDFSLSSFDPYAIYHILDCIASDNGLDFAIIPPTRNYSVYQHSDSFKKPVNFALENETLTENTLSLLGSENLEYKIKAFSIHLAGSLDIFLKNQTENVNIVHEIKLKLSRVHQVNPSNIVIVSLTSGSVRINYTVEQLSCVTIESLNEKLAEEFENFLSLDIHASFLLMQIEAQSFSPRWNRDFTVPKNCPLN